MQHVWETGQVHKGYWWGDEGHNQLEDLGTDARILRYIFKKWDGEARTGLIWFRLGTGGGSLSMR